jgi:propanol-preferring alcohol dehydrogenase
MLAYRLLQPQTKPEFQEVPDPHAEPGQVVVRVAGSGLCHTDFTVISRDRQYWNNDPPPFTLGHEIAGWVEEVEGCLRCRVSDCMTGEKYERMTSSA